jgi:AcrR family transcriptional regulator
MAIAADATRFEFQRDRILRAAAACFNQKGYSGTSLKDVARRLGLTDAALYYYVRSKEELVYQCYLRAADLGRRAMDRARESGGSGFEQVCLYIRNHVEIMVGDAGPVGHHERGAIAQTGIATRSWRSRDGTASPSRKSVTDPTGALPIATCA